MSVSPYPLPPLWTPVLGAVVLAVAAVSASSRAALDARRLEDLATRGETEQIWHTADSLRDAGAVSPSVAASLKAYAANRPGYWERYGTAVDSLFTAAILGMQEDGLPTLQDSVWFFNVLLSAAYHHSRGAALSVPGHDEAEESVLRTVLTAAPLPEQRVRAALELGRKLRFHSPAYATPTDCTAAARGYLQAAVSSDAGGLRPYALWQLAWLEAESVRWTDAIRAAWELARELPATKWHPRSAGIIAMQPRRELSVDLIAVIAERLRIRGTARNLAGTVTATASRIDTAWVHRHVRMPFASERVPTSAAGTAIAALDAGVDGAIWEVALPEPPPGFYRCTVAVADTTLTFVVGLLDIAVDCVSGDSLCVANRSQTTIAVRAGSGDQGCVGARILPAGASWCMARPGPHQFVVYDGAHAGWCGPPLTGPPWRVTVGGRPPSEP